MFVDIVSFASLNSGSIWRKYLFYSMLIWEIDLISGIIFTNKCCKITVYMMRYFHMNWNCVVGCFLEELMARKKRKWLVHPMEEVTSLPAVPIMGIEFGSFHQNGLPPTWWTILWCPNTFFSPIQTLLKSFPFHAIQASDYRVPNLWKICSSIVETSIIDGF